MQNAEEAFGARAKHGAQPLLGCLAPKQSPQALQGRDVESSVARAVAKGEASGVGKGTEKSLRKWQSENAHCGSTVWQLTGRSPAQGRAGSRALHPRRNKTRHL